MEQIGNTSLCDLDTFESSSDYPRRRISLLQLKTVSSRRFPQNFAEMFSLEINKESYSCISGGNPLKQITRESGYLKKSGAISTNIKFLCNEMTKKSLVLKNYNIKNEKNAEKSFSPL